MNRTQGPGGPLYLAVALVGSLAMQAAGAIVYPQRANPETQEPPVICVVVRTYWGHGRQPSPDLTKLLTSLQRQQVTQWEALLVVMDSKPFEELPQLLQGLHDERIWHYADWIGPQFTPRQGGEWAPEYHSALYNLTDRAVRTCPPSTRWVLVTNGDNEYAAGFFERLLAAGDADMVAFDFYSRYHRSTHRPCDRFAAAPGMPACKSNRVKWCHTDLGANALSWPRLMAEDRRFGAAGTASAGLGADHFDGVLAQMLLEDGAPHVRRERSSMGCQRYSRGCQCCAASLIPLGWRVHHVEDACLYDHSPTPQRCARGGGVWDDTEAAGTQPGGACLLPEAAKARVATDPGLEQVQISLAHDGRLASFLPSDAEAPSTIMCIRERDVERAHREAMTFYGRQCAAEEDVPEWEAFQAAGGLEADADAQAKTAPAWGPGPSARPHAIPPGPPRRDAAHESSFRQRMPAAMEPIKLLLPAV